MVLCGQRLKPAGGEGSLDGTWEKPFLEKNSDAGEGKAERDGVAESGGNRRLG